jgi:hypothetical protein
MAQEAHRFDQCPEIRAALEEAGVPVPGKPSVGPHSSVRSHELPATQFDHAVLASRCVANERLYFTAYSAKPIGLRRHRDFKEVRAGTGNARRALSATQ